LKGTSSLWKGKNRMEKGEKIGEGGKGEGREREERERNGGIGKRGIGDFAFLPKLQRAPIF